MTVKEFDEFVERQRAGVSDDSQVNWEQERDEWLAHLDVLYRKIEDMLSRYTSSGQIQVGYKQIELNEEEIGSYHARQMILRIGRQEVDLVPAGTRRFFFNGWVHVIGSAGEANLVLAGQDRVTGMPRMKVRIHTGGKAPVEPFAAPDKSELIWRIFSRPPNSHLFELNEESLFQLIMEVTNG
jgi:hypothetical protein